mmetsp:Transcript_178529/g.572151  ORF Transcript_178529/g.572151 Transcript_178529/m.572151 type:complete len:204 (-) Transcript_178529:555-1166(-)
MLDSGDDTMQIKGTCLAAVPRAMGPPSTRTEKAVRTRLSKPGSGKPGMGAMLCNEKQYTGVFTCGVLAKSSASPLPSSPSPSSSSSRMAWSRTVPSLVAPPASSGGPRGHKYARKVRSNISATTQMPSLVPLTCSCCTAGGRGCASASPSACAGGGSGTWMVQAGFRSLPKVPLQTLNTQILGVARPATNSFMFGRPRCGATS